MERDRDEKKKKAIKFYFFFKKSKRKKPKRTKLTFSALETIFGLEFEKTKEAQYKCLQITI